MPQQDDRWTRLQARHPLPNPAVRHVTETMHDQFYHRAQKFQDLNPELQRHYYNVVEATMKALGKL